MFENAKVTVQWKDIHEKQQKIVEIKWQIMSNLLLDIENSITNFSKDAVKNWLIQNNIHKEVHNTSIQFGSSRYDSESGSRKPWDITINQWSILSIQVVIHELLHEAAKCRKNQENTWFHSKNTSYLHRINEAIIEIITQSICIQNIETREKLIQTKLKQENTTDKDIFTYFEEYIKFSWSVIQKEQKEYANASLKQLKQHTNRIKKQYNKIRKSEEYKINPLRYDKEFEDELYVSTIALDSSQESYEKLLFDIMLTWQIKNNQISALSRNTITERNYPQYRKRLWELIEQCTTTEEEKSTLRSKLIEACFSQDIEALPVLFGKDIYEEIVQYWKTENNKTW